jgi:hypothetical protein
MIFQGTQVGSAGGTAPTLQSFEDGDPAVLIEKLEAWLVTAAAAPISATSFQSLSFTGSSVGARFGCLVSVLDVSQETTGAYAIIDDQGAFLPILLSANRAFVSVEAGTAEEVAGKLQDAIQAAMTADDTLGVLMTQVVGSGNSGKYAGFAFLYPTPVVGP